MNFLLKHKWHYLSIAIISGLFFVSVQVRKEKLALPLSTELEWVTAHTLITLQIWEEEGGPQKFGFNPIYTYKGEGNKAVGNLGGVMAPDGRIYYTSYPPFAFIFAYYGCQIIGEPDLSSLRALGLVTHLFCALLIYLIVFKLRKCQKDVISIAGLTTAFLYLFSAGTLWMHGIMYFADSCVQLFLILGIYFLVRLIKNDIQKPFIFLLLFGAVIFLGVYTEWLALFFAFFTGILLVFLYYRQKNRLFLSGFLAIAVGSALALSLTIIQYSSIGGWSQLVIVSKAKFQERSGFSQNGTVPTTYNWSNPESFELIEQFANRNFAMVINVVGVTLVLLLVVLFFKRFRNQIKLRRELIFIPLIVFLAVITHYILFFNFNAIHSISNLKTGFFLILLIGVVVLIIEEVLTPNLKWLLGGVLLIILIPRTIVELEKFDQFYHYESFNQNRSLSARLVKTHHNKDKYVFANIYVTPEYIYQSNHNVFQLADTAQVDYFMDYFNTDQAQFYYHQGDIPLYLLEYEKSDGVLQVKQKIDFKKR